MSRSPRSAVRPLDSFKHAYLHPSRPQLQPEPRRSAAPNRLRPRVGEGSTRVRQQAEYMWHAAARIKKARTRPVRTHNTACRDRTGRKRRSAQPAGSLDTGYARRPRPAHVSGITGVMVSASTAPHASARCSGTDAVGGAEAKGNLGALLSSSASAGLGVRACAGLDAAGLGVRVRAGPDAGVAVKLTRCPACTMVLL